MSHTQTPSQTIGPFFGYGLTPKQYNYDFGNICGPELAKPEAKGEHIIIRGQVFDGGGTTVNDAMLELWQADSEGNYHQQETNGFISFGRVGTGTEANNVFEFKTIKPGSVNGQAPFIDMIVFMRGLLSHQYTRIYFEDEAAANAQDALLQQVESARQKTLIATKGDNNIYTFNIHMQGENETVFFDL